MKTPSPRTALATLAVLGVVMTGAIAAPLKLPALTGRVVDNAGVLPPQVRAELDARLARHEQTSREQVVVATLASLQGVPIEDFGVALGRHWGIGQKKENTGALVLVAPKERETRIEVGYGLEGKLTDAITSDIIQRVMLPAFRAGDYATGVLQGTDAVLAALGDTDAAARSPAPVPAAQRGLPIPFLLFLIAFWLLSGLRRRRRGLFGGGFGGGGFGGGGGGFRGGGGGFGGGGASGRW